MPTTTTAFLGRATHVAANLSGGLPYIDICPDGRYGEVIALHLGTGIGPEARSSARHALDQILDAVTSGYRLLDDAEAAEAGPDDDEDDDEDEATIAASIAHSDRMPEVDWDQGDTTTTVEPAWSRAYTEILVANDRYGHAHPMTEAELRAAYGDR